MKYTIDEIKLELKEIEKKEARLEKQIEKMEDDGLYDDSLFKEMSALEDKRNDLHLMLSSLEKEAV